MPSVPETDLEAAPAVSAEAAAVIRALRSRRTVSQGSLSQTVKPDHGVVL